MPVELTTIALCVATLVVLILLMSCAGSPKRRSGPSYHRQNQCGREGMQDLDSISDHQLSNYGRGEENRNADQRNSDLQDLDGYEDYNSVAQYQSLEPEVYESHEEYSGNIGVASHGASALSTTSHDNYPVPFVGLRRPDMHSIYADTSARQQHSEYADQMPSHTSYTL
jgi:hypothetical protein